MPRDRDQPAAVRVYTVCDESKYLVVRNVPSLGCGDDLANLFGTYGPVEECKPMDAEDCEPYTDVFFIKFSQVSNARFAKRKLDESVFFGNRLQVSYAPHFESLFDTKEKLEVRRKEVLGRIKCVLPVIFFLGGLHSFVFTILNDNNTSPVPSSSMSITNLLTLTPGLLYLLVFSASAGRPQGTFQNFVAQGSSIGNSQYQMKSNKREYVKTVHVDDPRFSHVPSNKNYFPSESMNATVNLVREKLDKIQSGGDNSNAASAATKKPRVDNRRRI